MKKENSLFHFFPKKMEFLVRNGYWLLPPPLRDCNLNIHLNGLVHKYEDLYSEKINDLNKKIYDNSNNTKINEFLLDLIDTIREQAPPLPNMNNNKIFSFYFQLFNKEYNVEFSKTAMNNLNKLNNEVMNNILGIKEEIPVVTEEKPPEPPKEEVVVTEESKDGKNKKKEADKKKNDKDKNKKEEVKQEETKEEEKKEEEPKKEEPKNEEIFIPKDENEEKNFGMGLLMN